MSSLSEDLDCEDGRLFISFIKKNLKQPLPYDVFVMYDQMQNMVIGTASLIPDDQSVGKRYGLDGIWLGGVNIRRERRNQGYGTRLIRSFDSYVKNLETKPIRVNLFSDNPVAIKIYEKFGFIYSGLDVIVKGKINKIYYKSYK